MEIVPHYALTSAIDDLNRLKDGWLEGRGVAPSREELARLAEELIEVFPAEIDYTAVVPTEDGNVSLEWIRPTARIELEINYKVGRLELYATDIESDSFTEEAYASTDWAAAFGRITTLLG